MPGEYNMETRAERFERDVPVINEIIDARIVESGGGDGAALAGPSDYPGTDTTNNTVGVSIKAARSDHSHSGASLTDLTNGLATKANTNHTHDDRYYTESEIDTALAGKASSSHTHTIANVTGLQTAIDGKQATDQDLTDIAALTASNNDFLQRKSGAWTNRTIAQVKTDLAYATVATSGSFDDLTNKPDPSFMVEKYYQDEYGIYSITGSPIHFLSSSPWGATDHNISALFVPAGKAITAVRVAIRVSASFSATSAASQVKIYDVTGALIGSSPDDNTMALARGWSLQTLSTPIASSGSNRYVFVGVSLGGFAGASLAWPTGISTDVPEITSVGSFTGLRRGFYASNASGLPGSFNPASYGTATSYLPLLGLVA